MSSREGTPWSSIPDRDWNAWQWHMSHRIRTGADLAEVLTLTDSERDAMQAAGARLRTDLTPYFATLLSRDDAGCPLRRQVVPQMQELQVLAHESADPLAEDEDSPVPGLVHRYPDRVALFTTSQCAAYCRFCTRSRIVGKPFRPAGPAGLRPAIDYIAAHHEVRDVLLTGGDPLLLSDGALDALLGELRAIPHVEIVRINTRIPIFLPQRIDGALVDTLKRHHPLWINVHVNHPKELAPEARAAITRLADAGIPLGSQSLLMAGINDCPNVFRSLVHQLVALRVRPYYLYQCDPVLGSSHFVAPVDKGLDIIDALRGHTSGLCVPVFVIDAPGGGGKVALQRHAIVGHTADRVLVRTYEGDVVTYHQPRGYQSHGAATCGYCAAAAAPVPPRQRRDDLAGVTDRMPLDISRRIAVRRTADRGEGVFARAPFEPGDFILPVRGRVTEQQTQHSYQLGYTRHLVPDPPAGFLNHACVPNAGLRDAGEGGYDVIARIAIPVGAEITIDYAMTEFTHYPRLDPADEFDLGCRCGSPRCRGRLGYWSELPQEVRLEYRRAGMVARYLLETKTTAR